MREFVMYRGEKFWLQTTDRYFQSGRRGKKTIERLLHRRVWMDANGPIPEGMEVHHVDEDWRNNLLSNLELKDKSEHRREHQTKRMADPEFRAAAIQALRDNSDKAAEWHRSPEGREWHAKNGKEAWAQRRAVDAVCSICSRAYQTYFAERSRFCSKKCETAEFKTRHQRTKNCAHCGTQFSFLKYVEPACCSKTCASLKRWGHPPTAPAEEQLW